jgi:hypothetical protein
MAASSLPPQAASVKATMAAAHSLKPDRRALDMFSPLFNVG